MVNKITRNRLHIHKKNEWSSNRTKTFQLSCCKNHKSESSGKRIKEMVYAVTGWYVKEIPRINSIILPPTLTQISWLSSCWCSGQPYEVETHQWLEEVHEAASYHTGVVGIEALHPAAKPVWSIIHKNCLQALEQTNSGHAPKKINQT